MSGDETLTKEELRMLILDKQNDPEISMMPHKDQQDVVNDPNHPLRVHMREREKLIKIGLEKHGMHETDFTDPGWDMDE